MPISVYRCEVDHSEITPKACLDCAAQRGLRQAPDGTLRHCDLPYSALHAILHGQDHRVGLGVSVTQITSCWRKVWFEQHWDYTLYPSTQWAAQDGTFLHDGMERHMDVPGVWKETRLFKRLTNGVIISGQFDLWWPELGLIEDYKTKDHHIRFPPEGYILQLNLYRWMLETGAMVRIEPENPQSLMKSIKATQPITELALYSVAHQSFKRIKCPLMPFSILEEYVMAAMNHLLAHKPQEVGRKFADPAHSPFCTNWCSFASDCQLEGDLSMPDLAIPRS